MLRKFKNLYHLFQAIIANLWFGFPGKRLTVIGVTGTDGKTTTTSLIYHLLKSAGKKTAMISTVGAYIGDEIAAVGFHVTNPASWPLQSYIKKALDIGCEYLVLEVTSHGLDQNRVWGIPFTVGVLTNISHEHLDYHHTWEEYARTKSKLLAASQIAVVNMDDDSYHEIFNSHAKNSLLTYSLKNEAATYTPQKFPFQTKLIGEFNQANCLAAIAAAKAVGLKDVEIKKGIASFIAPVGRLQTVYDEKFRVIIDFAHTPNSFAQVLPVIKKLTKGKLIHVFGAAAKRDESKRPIMGSQSAKYADIIILTAEDPRGESVEKICGDIARGIGKKYQIITDRKAAIESAIKLALPGDTVILTGKSHEKSMNYGHGEESWDEFAVVKEIIRRL